MKDELKKYTDDHRQDFEAYSIDADDLWDGIESRLDKVDQKSNNSPWGRVLKVAAMIMVVCTIAFGYYLNSQRISIEKNGIALHNISSELADTEAFYTTQINEKIESIELVSGELDPAILVQLELLDEEYQSLKDDLKDDADSEEVVNAMIGYYRLKLNMLEKILNEIKKNKDNNGHEEVLAI